VSYIETAYILPWTNRKADGTRTKPLRADGTQHVLNYLKAGAHVQ